jgi:integrase
MKNVCNVAKPMVMATINLILDTRRMRMDGTYPLVFRIRHDKKFKDIASGYTVQENRFNTKTNRIIKEPVKNEHLDALLNHYYTRMKTYTVEHVGNIELEDLKNYMINKLPDEITLTELWQEEIDKLTAVGRLGNARAHAIALSVVSKIVDTDIAISKFTFKELIEIETTLLKRNVKTNSIGVYMRSLRTITNKAINLDYVPLSWYPFRKYKIKKQKTTPRVMTLDEVRAFFSMDLDEQHIHYQAWNVGRLIFLLRGINLKDLLTMTPANVVNDRIIYKRCKTSKMYSIKLTDEIKKVFDTFTSNTTLLGLHSENDLTSPKRVQLQNQRHRVINNHLKKLGESIGVSEPITSYVFRYSYANIAKQLGYNKDLIAEALGHDYGNHITGIYLEMFDLQILDDMNQQIIDAVV